MELQLSSRWTPFYKFILPVLAAGGLGFGAWSALLRPDEVLLPGGMTPALAWLLVAAIALLLAGLVWWSVAQLKHVVLDGDELVISNYAVEIRVPLSAVASISRRSATDPKRYTVTFEEPTEFGSAFTFVAPMTWSLNPWAESEEVTALRRAWEAARAGAARAQH